MSENVFAKNGHSRPSKTSRRLFVAQAAVSMREEGGRCQLGWRMHHTTGLVAVIKRPCKYWCLLHCFHLQCGIKLSNTGIDLE